MPLKCSTNPFFTSKDTEDSKDIRHQCMNLIPNMISESDYQYLQAKVSPQEISTSIHNLKDNKAPGPDGVPAEFYKSSIDWITQDLHDLYLETFANGALGNSINTGIIKLIPKEGDRALIQTGNLLLF